MPIAFRSRSAVQVQTGGFENFNVNKPAGVVDGDVMLLLYVCLTALAPTITGGWTSLDTQLLPLTNEPRTRLYYRVASGEPASYNVQTNAGSEVSPSVTILAFSGVSNASPIDVEGFTHRTTSSVNTTTIPANSITTSFPNDMLVGFVAWRPGSPAATDTPPTGMTQGGQLSSLLFEVDSAYGLQAAAGASGTKTWNLSNSNQFENYCIAYLVALTPQGVLTANTGAFNVTGNPANLLKGSVVSAAKGTFTLSGNAANLLKASRLTADKGTFTLTGNAVNFFIGFILAAAPGAFALTGNAASLRKDSVMPAAQGGFTLTGMGANLLKQSRLLAAGGVYQLVGKNAILTAWVPNDGRTIYVNSQDRVIDVSAVDVLINVTPQDRTI